MKRSRLLVAQLLAVTVLLAACSDEVAPPEPQLGVPQFSTTSEELTPENYIVVFEDKGSIPSAFAGQVEKLGGVVEAMYEPVGVAIVSNFDASAARQLAKEAGIRYVEEEPIIDIDEPVDVSEPAAADEPASPSSPSGAYFFPRQWNHRVIEADVAWAAGRLGSPGVTVAILDTGIDYLHADTYGRVDLTRSISFVWLDDLYVDWYFPGRHYITDLHYHGTHVASTVASNAWVAAGVTSQVTLMGVKVCSVLGGCPGSAIFSGFYYAVDNGADVISISFGGYFTKKDNPGYVSAINRLFNYAKRHRVTVAVSAGNAQLDLDHWKNGFKSYCDAPHVICVSATGPTSGGTIGPWPDPDTPAWYTNFGRSAISVAAPGGNTGAAVWAACSTTSLLIPVCQSSPYWSLGISGTSMAAPHVSALAALLVEDYGRNPGRIKRQVQKTAEDLGQRGTDPYYGKGRINVWNAVQ